MSRKAEIKLSVQLDADNIAQKIEWEATDADFDGTKPSDAFSLSIWDQAERTTLSFDLWTTEMTIHDMNVFHIQRLLEMAKTYDRATGGNELADMIANFAEQFATKVEEQIKKDAT